jgi:hypothetical protein
MKQSIAGMTGIACLTFGTWATAQQPTTTARDGWANLGNSGQVAISGERMMGVAADTSKTESEEGGISSSDTSKQTTVGLFGMGIGGSFGLLPRIGFDVFPIKGLSLGTALVYVSGWGKSEYETSGEGFSGSDRSPVTSQFLLHPRVGYAAAFNDTVAIWPRAGITYYRQQAEEKEDSFEWKDTVNATALSLEFLVAISPVNHFAFLIGPYADIGLAGKSKYEDDDPTFDDSEADLKLTSIGLTVNLTGFMP